MHDDVGSAVRSRLSSREGGGRAVRPFPPALFALMPAALESHTPEPDARAEAHPSGTLVLSTTEMPREDASVYQAERGVLHVQADRSTPGTGVFALEFHRFPALEEADPSTPPIFRLNVGPEWRDSAASRPAPESSRRTSPRGSDMSGLPARVVLPPPDWRPPPGR